MTPRSLRCRIATLCTAALLCSGTSPSQASNQPQFFAGDVATLTCRVTAVKATGENRLPTTIELERIFGRDFGVEKITCRDIKVQ